MEIISDIISTITLTWLVLVWILNLAIFIPKTFTRKPHSFPMFSKNKNYITCKSVPSKKALLTLLYVVVVQLIFVEWMTDYEDEWGLGWMGEWMNSWLAGWLAECMAINGWLPHVEYMAMHKIYFKGSKMHGSCYWGISVESENQSNSRKTQSLWESGTESRIIDSYTVNPGKDLRNAKVQPSQLADKDDKRANSHVAFQACLVPCHVHSQPSLRSACELTSIGILTTFGLQGPERQAEQVCVQNRVARSEGQQRKWKPSLWLT